MDKLLRDISFKEIEQKIMSNKYYAYKIYPKMVGEKRTALKNGTRLAFLCLYLVTKTNNRMINCVIYEALINNSFEKLYSDFDRVFNMLDYKIKNLIKQAKERIGVPIPNSSQNLKSDGYLLGELKENMMKIEGKIRDSRQMYNILLAYDMEGIEKSNLPEMAKLAMIKKYKIITVKCGLCVMKVD